MNEIVKFPANTPVEVTLQSETGKHVHGRYGEQVMYALADDRVMYVPPYVEQRLQELAIGAGEPLLICKKQMKEGERNRTTWSVKRALQQARTLKEWADTPAADGASREGSDGTGEAVNGPTKQQEQPSGNSTAPMAQELASTNHQHQRQDTAEGPRTEIVLASATPAHPVELSAKDRVFLPAMTLDVALARRSAIVEFTRRIMVRDQDFGESLAPTSPRCLNPVPRNCATSSAWNRNSRRLSKTSTGPARSTAAKSSAMRDIAAGC